MEDHQRQDDVLIKVLEERVNMWMESTTEYRKALCSKLDVVLEKINLLNTRIDKLPCDSRKPMWTWVERNVYALWGVIGFVSLAIIVNYFRR